MDHTFTNYEIQQLFSGNGVSTSIRYSDFVNRQPQTVFLTVDKKSWITLSEITPELKKYATDNYQKLYELHPQEHGKILLFNYNKVSPRWSEITRDRYHANYLNTPKFLKQHCSNFLFSGFDESKNNDDLPNEFKPFYDFMKANNPNYNQVGINWYGSGNEFVPSHSECEEGMVLNHDVAIMNLNEPTVTERVFTFKPFEKNINNMYNELDIVLQHGLIIKMFGNTQSSYKHGIFKTGNDSSNQSRIGMTFRQY